MKQITLNIDNPTIENILLNLSKQQNKPIDKIVVDLLIQFVNRNYQVAELKFDYKTLDADKYLTKIKYNTELKDTDNASSINPFNDISDSSKYIKDLRNNSWKR